jgi:hypothetical protein
MGRVHLSLLCASLACYDTFTIILKQDKWFGTTHVSLKLITCYASVICIIGEKSCGDRRWWNLVYDSVLTQYGVMFVQCWYEKLEGDTRGK